MKILSSLKTILNSILPILLLACLFVFSSNTDTRNSDQQVIAQLSADLEQMNEQLELLQTQAAENTVSSEPLIAEIAMFAGNFAPRGWAFCEGQKLSISENQALFSLIGTTYGGDGRSTFQLPDLRGKSVVHPKEGLKVNGVRSGRVDAPKNLALGAQEIRYIIALTGVFPSRS